MSPRIDSLSRSELIGGMLAAGALAACGGRANTTFAVPNYGPADRFGIDEILSDDIFDTVDKQALVEQFDLSPNLDALHRVFLAQAGQQPQTAKVILQIPSQGIVIQSPGTYKFGRDIQWRPRGGPHSAITILSSNVTLDFAGFTLTASVADKSRQIVGVLVAGLLGPAENVTITNGTVAGVTEYGILARNAVGLNVSRVTVTGMRMQNLAIRYLTPAGIQVSWSNGVAISGCRVTDLAVTTDSSAGIQLVGTNQATVTGCSISGLLNNDGAVQGYSYLGCTDVTTVRCTADSFQSHFNGNVKTTGHTVIGFCPIFCQNLSFRSCSASGLTGCCDDCHGMSIFLDFNVTVSGFRANNIVDGVSPSHSGAKATGLEVYGTTVTVTDCTVSAIKAIKPQDKQAAGFSAWGSDITFKRCEASGVSVQNGVGGAIGTGFGWAPDPRKEFRAIPAYKTTYVDCKAENCDVGFDTWNHVKSTWICPTYANCTTGILVQLGAKRTISCNPCSECSPPLKVTLTNLASENAFRLCKET